MKRLETSLLLVVLCCACDDADSAAPAASASVTRAAAGSGAYTPPSSLVPRHAPAPTPHCRVMSVRGKASLGDKPLEQGALKDGTLTAGESWLDIAAGAEVGLQHTTSAREWRVTGPARLKACVGGDETLFLAKGELKSGSGAGMRPGAQVTVATPQGSVLWGDTRLTLEVTNAKTQVDVEMGNALLVPAPGVKVQGKAEVQAKQRGTLSGPSDPVERSRTLLESCEAAASEAARLAREVLSPSAPAPSASSVATRGALGSRARSHAEARGKARELCAAAWASVGSVKPDSAEVSEFERRLDAADQRWREVPMP
ncbi:MAG: hypothetical protein KC766_10600, partial [Myxococcales bacterium]|nr:hypothetical protein [Myxococcales bacterium]